LPDVPIRWRDAWIGALVTGVLFAAGQGVLRLYLQFGTVGTAYGAAGSLVVLLMWVYYSALVFMYGAEFTYIYAKSARWRAVLD
jgi:membrane protein